MLPFLCIQAGYNNVEVAEYLLENGADVNAQDKGGLIPLHNASSYGHVDIAALLITFNASVNAVDKWGFTPLHEAAQKGRTQLCSLLVSESKQNMGLSSVLCPDCHCIPGRKSGIFRIQYGHAAAAEISFQTR